MQNTELLRAENVSVEIGGRRLLQQVSLKVQPGEVHVIMGANGAGKSTLLKSLSGTGTITGGSIFFHRQPLPAWTCHKLAAQRAFLSQHTTVSMPFSAYDIIAMGRYVHAHAASPGADGDVVASVAAITHTTHLLHQNYLTLSGGEKQRVQLARVLAQLTPPPQQDFSGKLLLLDEPVTALDIKHQYGVMKTVSGLTQQGLAVLCVLHDIGMALQYATHVHLMKQGRMFYQAPVADITAAMISETFDVPVRLQREQGNIMVQVFAA